MDPLMVRLIKDIHEERIQYYTQRRHVMADHTTTGQTPLLQLKKAIMSLAQKVMVNSRPTSVKPSSHS